MGFSSATGCTDRKLFLQWLEHFVKLKNSSPERKHLLVLDGHHSHKSLEANDYCREHGVELITLPPHSLHKIQPLDKTFFRSLKAAYNAEIDCWMVQNPGKIVTLYDVAPLSKKAFMKTAIPERAQN